MGTLGDPKRSLSILPLLFFSQVGPLQSSKLFNEVRNSMDQDKNPNAHYETPYVVHLQNRAELAPPQPLFTFVHPLKGKIDNSRYVCWAARKKRRVIKGFGKLTEWRIGLKDVLEIDSQRNDRCL